MLCPALLLTRNEPGMFCFAIRLLRWTERDGCCAGLQLQVPASDLWPALSNTCPIPIAATDIGADTDTGSRSVADGTLWMGQSLL